MPSGPLKTSTEMVKRLMMPLIRPLPISKSSLTAKHAEREEKELLTSACSILLTCARIATSVITVRIEEGAPSMVLLERMSSYRMKRNSPESLNQLLEINWLGSR